MSNQIVPTKGNLLATKKSLALAKVGFELLDRKRNILIREMMSQIDEAAELQSTIYSAHAAAYAALQRANITLGFCSDLALTVPLENGLNVSSRSVMGVEIPTVQLHSNTPAIPYGFQDSNSALDEAYLKFNRVKELIARLAEVDNSVYRLADAVKKTQKRANALRNIVIPRFEDSIKFITDALEEKDREEFSRMKVIKRQKQRD